MEHRAMWLDTTSVKVLPLCGIEGHDHQGSPHYLEACTEAQASGTDEGDICPECGGSAFCPGGSFAKGCRCEMDHDEHCQRGLYPNRY